MILPNQDFRPNPARAVWVHGTIDQQMVYRLTPRIVTLQAQSRSPITVYIDSPGGDLVSMETLWRLLSASDQDSAPPCRIITAATARAASAAADLLSSGDYAVALRHSTILYHGSRTFRELPLTAQTTSVLGHLLRITNEQYAAQLIGKIESRFMFRFLLSKGAFKEVRKKHAPNPVSDVECFLSIVSDSLSDRARKLFATARERHGRYDKLLKKAKSQKVRKGSRLSKVEASRISAILEFELEENSANKDFSFQRGGLILLTDDFFLLSEYLAGSQSERLNRMCARWGRFALSPKELEEINQGSEANRETLLVERVRPLLEPLWGFFVALCHALQESENELTATDAYWLGLIDEVVGDDQLISLRHVAEYKEDEPPAPAATGTAELAGGSPK